MLNHTDPNMYNLDSHTHIHGEESPAMHTTLQASSMLHYIKTMMHDVISHVIIQLSIVNFMYVLNRNQTHIFS